MVCCTTCRTGKVKDGDLPNWSGPRKSLQHLMMSTANFYYSSVSPCTSNLHRVASFMVVAAKFESLVMLGASLALFGKLQQTQDVFKVSLEIRKVGACAVLTSGECWFAPCPISPETRHIPPVSCYSLQSGPSVPVLTRPIASGVFRGCTVWAGLPGRYGGVCKIGTTYHTENATQ